MTRRVPDCMRYVLADYYQLLTCSVTKRPTGPIDRFIWDTARSHLFVQMLERGQLDPDWFKYEGHKKVHAIDCDLDEDCSCESLEVFFEAREFEANSITEGDIIEWTVRFDIPVVYEPWRGYGIRDEANKSARQEAARGGQAPIDNDPKSDD